MSARRGTDVQYIEVFGLKHLLKILVDLGNLVHPGKFFGLRQIRVAQSDDLGDLLNLLPSRQMLLFRDESRSDQAHSKTVQASNPPHVTIL